MRSLLLKLIITSPTGRTLPNRHTKKPSCVLSCHWYALPSIWTDASFRSSASLRTPLSMTYVTINDYEGIRLVIGLKKWDAIAW